MFNFDQAIADWRRQMADGGTKSSSVLDELESHLREETQKQIHSGLTEQEAFEIAVQRMGKVSALKDEFRKIGGASSVAEKVMIGVCVVLVSSVALLGVFTAVVCYANWGERVMAAAAMLCTILVACCWRYAVPFLPVFANARKRWAIGLGCIASGIAACSFYCNVILPRFEVSPDHQLPAIGVWAVFLIAIFTCAGVGLLMSERERANWGMKSSRLRTSR